jgi:SM-20-related protein
MTQDAGIVAPLGDPAAKTTPVFVQRNFFDTAIAGALCDYAFANATAFQPTRIGPKGHGRDDPKRRISLGSKDLGPFKPILEQAVIAHLPRIFTGLSIAPLEPRKLEIEMIAHGDGAFYGRHIDLNPRRESETIRALSGVYYFHTEPKAFTGGQLRLYPSATGAVDRYFDVEPEHNSFAVFPSWLMHEVMPVQNPSGRFEESRFSINCWIHVARKQG